MSNEIISATDKIISEKGTTKASAIPILQALQEKYNYLPQEALQRVCKTTDISLSQIYGISTFYTQFRHKPVGKHIVKVCVGTACHVKGALLVYEAIKRELKISENDDTDANSLFTIEKVACLGCCTIAPVVQIDSTTYGFVETNKIKEIFEDFLSNENNIKTEPTAYIEKNKKLQGEIRIGLGSCCIASGSADVKTELQNSLKKNKINVSVKHKRRNSITTKQDIHNVLTLIKLN